MNDISNGDLVPPTLKVSAAERMQRFQEDDAALAELAVKVHERAMSDSENANAAAHTDILVRQRRAAMWGYDAPQRTDMVLVAQSTQPKSSDKIRATIMGFIDRLPPEQKALRKRLEQMSAAEALERLGPPKPLEGDGTASTASEDAA
jgi:hypothetical protein